MEKRYGGGSMPTDGKHGDAELRYLHSEIRKTIGHLLFLLSKLPPEEAEQQPVLVPIGALKEIVNCAQLSDQFIKYAYELDDYHLKERTKESFLTVLGKFLESFRHLIQKRSGNDRAKFPTFLEVALGEIADLQRNTPSKYFSVDEKASYNPQRAQYLGLKSSAAVYCGSSWIEDKNKQKAPPV